MREKITLWDWQSRMILRRLNLAIERLAVLKEAGVDVPHYEVSEARNELLRVLIPHAAAEVLTETDLKEAPELPSPIELPASPASHSPLL